MTNSYTTTSTFTRTNAEYLASKVASDLKQMQCFYGSPSDFKIAQYIQEIVILLLNNCLTSVKYGFKRNGFWVVFVEYKALFGSIKTTDDNSGRIYPGVDISGAEWYSFLSSSYSGVPTQTRLRIEQSLPFSRTSGSEPRFGLGNLKGDKYYSSGGGAFQRQIYY